MTEWLSAIGSFGQFVVVSAAALFAVFQLRQIRRQVDLQSIESFLNYSRSEEFEILNDAVRRLHDEGPKAWSDPLRWESDDFRRVVRFAVLGNHIGVLVAARLIREEMIVPAYRPFLLRAWDVLVPWIAAQRHAGETTVPMLAAFESLVVRMTGDGFVDRFAQMRKALPPAARTRYDESNAHIRALYEASLRTNSSK